MSYKYLQLTHGLKPWWGIRPWRRHSLVLMVAGLAYVAIGNSYILAAPTEARRRALVIALSWFPIQYWGAIWIMVGVGAIISARWPPVVETWGYVALTGLSAGWSATYLMGIIFKGAPSSGFTQVIVWGLMAFLWWAISGLVNPDKVVVITSERLDHPPS